MAVNMLTRIDSRPIGDDPMEIRAFMTLRNEMLRLPQTLDHHRKLGISRFFGVDNGSTDGTGDFLLAQPDCHVFLTHDSFARARCGLDWKHALLDEYGVDHWCLVIDADEWFVYPGCEKRSLSDLAAHLETEDAQGMFAFLLDMYGPKTGDGTISACTSLLDASGYFDRDYVWHRRFHIPGLQGRRFPEFDITGGVRWRVLLPTLHRHYYLVWLIRHLGRLLKIPLPPALTSVPTLTKIPFVRWLPGTRYQHVHATVPIKLSEVTAVLLHFKLMGDFPERVKTEVSRKEHFNEAAEYLLYLEKLVPDLLSGLGYSGSVRYQDSEQLLQMGLLREDKEWCLTRICEPK